MRVCVFIDGKNFHAGFKGSTSPGTRIDFPAMAAWLVERAGGSTLWGAHYYTGVERGGAARTEAQVGLDKFLRVLECQPGFFVHRFPRKAEHNVCPECGTSVRFTHEKEVDTTMVADMLRLAAVDGFDVLVLVPGDADLAPAVENVRSLGKKVFVATWGTASLAARMRQTAFDHLDLAAGVASFSRAASLAQERTFADGGVIPVPPDGTAPATEHAMSVFVHELSLAQLKMASGYVGVSFFIHRWRSPVLDGDPQVRQRLLNRAVDEGLVEIYDAPDGAKAIRRLP